MWSEEINKKIEEAEGSNNPAFNDQAWDKMELLLDKHLPQKRKKRRFILLLLPLLLGGGAIFFINQQKRTNDVSITKQETTIVKPSPASDKPTGNTGNETTLTKTVTDQPATEEITVKNTLPKTSIQNPAAPGSQQKINSGKIKTPRYDRDDISYPPFISKKITSKKERTRGNDINGNDINNVASERTVTSDLPPSVENSVVKNTNPVKANSSDPVLIDSSTEKTVAAADTKQKDTTQAEIAKAKVKDPKSKTSTGSRFSLNLSFGPDVSAVGVDNPGKVDMLYGVGIGYAISKRLTIRTGFFAVSKIYTADSSDYKTAYPIHKLQKIDANCLVYEIPVTLLYNFPSAKKHNWFVSGGLSSYLMKKETYGYHYENAWGQPQYYKRSYENENTHLFSVINLSGGYQYHFSDRFSIMAEPYIKIPTSGVGEGKVKLNSAGMLFTVGFKPFVRKN